MVITYRLLLIAVGLFFFGCENTITQARLSHDGVTINADIRGYEEGNDGSMGFLFVRGRISAWDINKKLKSMDINCLVATMGGYKSEGAHVDSIAKHWTIISAKDGVVDEKVCWPFTQPIARPHEIKFDPSSFELMVDEKNGSCFEFTDQDDSGGRPYF